MGYRFFFFFLDFFFSRRGDGEQLSELLTEWTNNSQTLSSPSGAFLLLSSFIFSPVSVLVFLFLLPAALLGRRFWIIWIFHQPERATDLESGTEIMLVGWWLYITLLFKTIFQSRTGVCDWQTTQQVLKSLKKQEHKHAARALLHQLTFNTVPSSELEVGFPKSVWSTSGWLFPNSCILMQNTLRKKNIIFVYPNKLIQHVVFCNSWKAPV